MIQLMLNGPGQKALGLHLKEGAGLVLGLQGHLFRPCHIAPAARHAQAALHHADFSLIGGDLRVHQLHQPFPHINHHQAAQNAHLGRRQAHAVGFVHGVRHVP